MLAPCTRRASPLCRTIWLPHFYDNRLWTCEVMQVMVGPVQVRVSPPVASLMWQKPSSEVSRCCRMVASGSSLMSDYLWRRCPFSSWTHSLPCDQTFQWNNSRQTWPISRVTSMMEIDPSLAKYQLQWRQQTRKFSIVAEMAEYRCNLSPRPSSLINNNIITNNNID